MGIVTRIDASSSTWNQTQGPGKLPGKGSEKGGQGVPSFEEHIEQATGQAPQQATVSSSSASTSQILSNPHHYGMSPAASARMAQVAYTRNQNPNREVRHE